jgi:hypothetical protein
MARFILRFRDHGAVKPGDLERIRAVPGLVVIDQASMRMLLVDASMVDLRALLADLPGWDMVEERTTPLPDTRQKPRRPPREGP